MTNGRYPLLRPVIVSELFEHLGIQEVQSGEPIIGVASITNSTPGYLTFSTSSNYLKSPGAIVIAEQSGNSDSSQVIVTTSNPRHLFVRALNWLQHNVGFQEPPKGTVHPSAVIDARALVEDGARIGPDTTVGPFAVVRKCVSIGAGCVIGPGVSIGDAGFGFSREGNSEALEFHHLGGVVIGNRVTIGANSTIARGTLCDTLISDGVRIDNLVHVAHNTAIQSGAMIAAGAIVSGSVKILENTWVAPNASIRDGIELGKESFVGIGAVVIRSTSSGEVLFGNPAKAINGG
jgi:UDP-3-O-[3-hydroxymyristoyl] glucosamine N-acyltransferase